MRRALFVVAALSSSLAHAQQYRFPLSGGAPYITAHRDDDGGGGLSDYACGTNTYQGHGGTDIGIGGFAAMDDGSVDVVAAADGVVGYANDGCFDRCTTGDCGCGDGFGNFVRIDHADGKVTYYGHMMQGSVAVGIGDAVACGQYLGKVGSSGSSTGPHLHFEPRLGGNVSDDPYAGDCGGPSSYWVDQGAYGGLPSSACEGSAAQPPPPPDLPPAGHVQGVVFEDVGSGTADMSVRLPGATVEVVGLPLSTTATGDGAEWAFDLFAGATTFRASAPGYVTAERTCDVAANATTWCSVGLVRAPVDEPPQPPDDTTGPPPDDTTAPPPDDTTGPPPDDTTAPPPDDTTAPPPDDDDAPARVIVPATRDDASCAQASSSTSGLIALAALAARRGRRILRP